LKAIHIHTDLKFIIETQKYEGNYFENQVIIINNQRSYTGTYEENAIFFNYAPKSVIQIVKLCEGADLVVLYDLDIIKCQIALKLHPGVTIAWRFFGYEWYKRNPKPYLSIQTQNASALTRLQKLNKTLHSFITNVKTGLVWGYYSDSYFMEAILRVHIFLGVIREEYILLKEQLPELPVFVRIPMTHTNIAESNSSIKEKLVILGNNRSVYNNHLDIIEIIDSSSDHADYKFILLFNYGPQGTYSRSVCKAIKGKEYYDIVDNFMPFNELCDIYQRASAAIFNGYRQMALGNIFLAISYKVKLYLNDRSPVLHWLKNQGFNIYSIDYLADDLVNDNLRLTDEIANHNYNLLTRIQESYRTVDFQKDLCLTIKEIIQER
jgi:hypothetical protein